MKQQARRRQSRTAPATTRQPEYFSSQVAEARRFYLELNPAVTKHLTVISGGRERCRPDYDLSRPGFPFPTIEFVAYGTGELTLRNRSWKLQPGSVFFYGRGVPHRIRCTAGQSMIKYFVVFNGSEGDRLLNECHILPGHATWISHPEQVQLVFDDLIRHGLSDSANRARMCRVALHYLIMKIDDLALPPGEMTTPALATYRRCRDFIETHFLRVRTLQEIADACHVDAAYLCRVFQRFGRESPFHYLQHLRMNRAADLLQNHKRRVKEVALELNFTDPYNFSRAFKRVFGVPPEHLIHAETGTIDNVQ